MNKLLTIQQAREVVRARHPEATQISNGTQVWIQSAPDGVTISDAFTFRSTFDAQTKAWRSAAKNVKSESADAAYKFARAKVDGLLAEVTAKLECHSEAQSQDPKNWGYVGDMKHYAELLEEFLGKRG